MNRRAFCVSAAALALARRVHAANALPRGRDPKSQLAVSTYPFRGSLVAPNNNRRDAALPGMTVEQFAEFTRDRFGLAAIEVLGKHFESTDDTYLRELRGKLAKQRVALVNIPMDDKTQLCSPNSELREAAMTLHRKWIDAAVIVGCPSVRVRMPVGEDPKALDATCAADALRQLARYAKTRGILLSLENDSPFTESPAQLTAMIQAVGSPALHVLPDFGNELASGDEAANLAGMRQLLPLAYNIAHAKDWELIGGVRKEIHLQPVVDAARAAGYRGWYSLESDARQDPAADTSRLVQAMVTCLSKPLAQKAKASRNSFTLESQRSI